MSERTKARPILQLSRVIAAPRERVFQAWTDPIDLERWWGRPEGVDVPEVEVDLRVGGGYRIVMQAGPGGPIFPLTGTFIEVVPPERLVYSFRWERDLPFPGGDYTSETRVTIEFREAGDATEIVLTHEGFSNEEVKQFHNFGWERSFHLLARLCERS